MDGIYGAGAALGISPNAEANQVTDAGGAIEDGEIANVEEEARIFVQEETIAFLAIPFDDTCGKFGQSHWIVYRRARSAT